MSDWRTRGHPMRNTYPMDAACEPARYLPHRGRRAASRRVNGWPGESSPSWRERSADELGQLVHPSITVVSKVRPGLVVEGKDDFVRFVQDVVANSLYEVAVSAYQALDDDRVVVEGRLRWIDDDRVIRDDPVIWAMEFRDDLLLRPIPARTLVEAETILGGAIDVERVGARRVDSAAREAVLAAPRADSDHDATGCWCGSSSTTSPESIVPAPRARRNLARLDEVAEALEVALDLAAVDAEERAERLLHAVGVVLHRDGHARSRVDRLELDPAAVFEAPDGAPCDDAVGLLLDDLGLPLLALAVHVRNPADMAVVELLDLDDARP